MPKSDSQTKRDNPGNSKYPWDEWFHRMQTNKSHKITLHKGQHYECATHAMSVQVRRQSRLRGERVSVHIVDDSLVLTLESA